MGNRPLEGSRDEFFAVLFSSFERFRQSSLNVFTDCPVSLFKLRLVAQGKTASVMRDAGSAAFLAAQQEDEISPFWTPDPCWPESSLERFPRLRMDGGDIESDLRKPSMSPG